MHFNGTRVTKRGDTLFMPLPGDLRRPIEGGCSCAFCKAHPDLVPQWDVVACSPASPYAWTVHYPELTI
jgi:hypothetical protein